MSELLKLLNGIRDTIRLLLQMQRVTVAAIDPLAVTLPDGSTVRAVAVTGLTYTVGGAAVVLTASGNGQMLAFPVS